MPWRGTVTGTPLMDMSMGSFPRDVVTAMPRYAISTVAHVGTTCHVPASAMNDDVDIEKMLSLWACDCGSTKGSIPEFCRNPRDTDALYMIVNGRRVHCGCDCHERARRKGVWN